VSAASPWALDASVLEEKPHYIPVSHGEGKIFISEQLAKELFEKGQVYSQYCNENGKPTMKRYKIVI
ncbi:MAG: phosphoribosylformylglycinamidine synthase subunit PurQ, partial [Treponema sp.]|nr:phosphoribosylformylglycinamidine synthase subunit PurQ [Treponema sp.]